MSRLTVTLLLSLALSVGARADVDAARYFTERGRKALAEEDYKSAVEQFRKALSEQEGYAPALLGLAEAALGSGDEGTAVTRLEECIDCAARSDLTSEESGAVEEARELLKKLDRPRLDFREFTGRYVSQLLELARKSVKENPELTRMCVERILKIDPDHGEARDLLAEVGSGPSGGGPTAVPGETLLFNGKDLNGWTGQPPGFVVKGGSVIATAKGQTRYMRMKEPLRGDYTVVFEARIVEDHGTEPLLDFGAGFRGTYDRWALAVFANKIVFVKFSGTASDREKFVDAPNESLGDFDRFKWHTYRIQVKGDSIACSVDGQELGRTSIEPGTCDGSVSLVIQEAIAEVRKIAIQE